jgi:phage terminase large subunit-like protein
MNEQTARIEAESVFLPCHAGGLDDFRREILAFPAGRYTDQVDACRHSSALSLKAGER